MTDVSSASVMSDFVFSPDADSMDDLDNMAPSEAKDDAGWWRQPAIATTAISLLFGSIAPVTVGAAISPKDFSYVSRPDAQAEEPPIADDAVWVSMRRPVERRETAPVARAEMPRRKPVVRLYVVADEDA